MRHFVVAAALFFVSFLAIPAVGQTPSMLDPTVTQIAAGSSHTCALTTAGAVECWGLNGNGQLGNGSTSNAITPAVSGLTGIATIAAGGYHTCALTTTGAVVCWGRNGNGELGDSTTADKTTAVAVYDTGGPGLNGIVAIAAGSYHTCALTTAGAVKCWGLNSDGQLGDGTHTSKTRAVLVSGLSSGVVAIAAGGFHTCALTAAGTVKCWGYNVDGRLGDGTTTERIAPVAVSGLINVAAITAGNGHTCALTRTDTVMCWGSNASGQLGDGSTTNRLTPVMVSGLSNVATIAAGSGHTCALSTTGGLKCWGANGSGQLGNDGTANATAPVAVSGSASGIAAVATGGSHTCALDTTGGLTCWGYNAYGQIGDGTTVEKITPVSVSGLASGVVAIATGADHTCALTTAGTAMCWGRNNGQLGDGTFVGKTAPVPVIGLTGIAAIAAGYSHTCALDATGGLKCWGSNAYGQLGDGTMVDKATPVAVSGLASGVAAITAGGFAHTCALTTGGAVKCWGYNSTGQLGDGTTTTRVTPVVVSGLESGVAAIAVGDLHTCAVTTTGEVKCWGYNVNGQLGDGSTDSRSVPVTVSGLTSGVAAISAGAKHTCALTMAGAVKCWGYNGAGQLGDGTTTDTTVPVAVSGLDSGVVAITTGYYDTCALTSAGAAMCWGYNVNGQLGDGSTDSRSAPVAVSGLTSGVAAIAAGANHTCAVTRAGAAMCWGYNEYGQLGFGDTFERYVPATLIAGQSIVFVPSARMGAGGAVSLFASATGGAVSFDTWTPSICGVNASDKSLFFSPAGGLCGVRVSQAGSSYQSIAPAPQQLRLIQVEADLIFANGVDVWNGMKH
jgi:alpha-tubulin suppressor-like RCC1 family protein